MFIRPFILHEQKATEELLGHIAPALTQWCMDWDLPPVSEIQVEVIRDPNKKQRGRGFRDFLTDCLGAFNRSEELLYDYQLFSYTFLSEGYVPEICVICSNNVAVYTCSNLVAEQQGNTLSQLDADPQSLSARLLSKLYRDLLDRFLPNHRAVFPEVEDLVEKFARAGSGAVAARICFSEDRVFYLQFSFLALQNMFEIGQKKLTNMAPREKKKSEYLGLCLDATVNMEVRLPTVKVRIADIQKLSVGDVLKLGCDLDQPLDLYIDGEKESHPVYLGGVDESLAIKIQTLL